MYYFIVILLIISSGLFVLTTDKYLNFKKEKELFKAKIATKILIISFTIAIVCIYGLAIMGV
ncbi:MAG: hypothetical protein IKS93_05295 [Methanobrevibacter sp.]|nr:hypothetical protein [Methanobrevibacter sp.]